MEKGPVSDHIPRTPLHINRKGGHPFRLGLGRYKRPLFIFPNDQLILLQLSECMKNHGSAYVKTVGQFLLYQPLALFEFARKNHFLQFMINLSIEVSPLQSPLENVSNYFFWYFIFHTTSLSNSSFQATHKIKSLMKA